MTVVRVKGFKIFADQHGKPRCYHRKTGIAVDLTNAPLGSARVLCPMRSHRATCGDLAGTAPWNARQADRGLSVTPSVH